ncbi:MAG TPA: carboxymuconolactone decarboxylase family protein [Polyangiaceae bacterium]|jgi:alkyl hydroperoxide reductase subunit D|nr:carboxymuconolactone decarboxylase family protein [Polyangiaceae bacterium]
MATLEELRETFPHAARDIKINLQNVLTPGTLNEAQVWGVAIASAEATRNTKLAAAVLEDAKAKGIGDEVVEDARAAAILMAMNNVFYRFRHIVDKEEYAQKPARLRMQRLAQVTSNKTDFELFCLAVSAINNCQTCVRSHEEVVLKGGLTTDHVLDAVRIAATIAAAAQALEIV